MMDKTINDLVDFYRKNPLECFDVVFEQDDSGRTCADIILIILFTLDEVIRHKCKKDYFFYIESFDTILFIIVGLDLFDVDTYQFEANLIKLDICKLIYKFTCAKKFHIGDTSICQLRINSWGREYIRRNDLLTKYKTEYLLIKEFVELYINNNIGLYKEITNLLLKEINIDNAEKINKLNDQIEIKLLS